MARLPHLLSFGRVLLVLGAYVAVAERDIPLFATLVLLAVLTDVLDGPIARATGSASKFGANVDTAADMMFYLSLPVWTWQFRPEVVTDHAFLIGAFIVLYLVANFTSQRVFGALGVHNRLSRASGSSGVFFGLYTILWGFDVRLYYVLMAVLLLDLAQRYGAILRALRGKGRGRASGNP